AHLGPRPVYISADAANRPSLQAAYRVIKQSHPSIHGVIHAATGVFDRTVTETSEAHFREVLSAEIDASVYVADVFRADVLDFILYFSSVVTLEKSGGFCGYAAGGAFTDALACHLNETAGCSVKVINWGHWRIGTGAAISENAK